jgi:hypothetical protein
MTRDGANDPALAALPLGVWVVGPDSRLVFANAATRQVTGIDPAETPPGLPAAELVRRLAYRGIYGEGDPEALAAEAIGRTLATRLYELTDDPGMKDMLRFLIARDTMHQQQWLAVLEELGPEQATNAPGDFENEGEHAAHAYEFLNHNMDAPLPPDARWTSGPSLDGKGEFALREPAPALGQEPTLQPAPPEVHAGVEATGDGKSVFGRFTRGLGAAVEKVTP